MLLLLLLLLYDKWVDRIAHCCRLRSTKSYKHNQHSKVTNGCLAAARRLQLTHTTVCVYVYVFMFACFPLHDIVACMCRPSAPVQYYLETRVCALIWLAGLTGVSTPRASPARRARFRCEKLYKIRLSASFVVHCVCGAWCALIAIAICCRFISGFRNFIISCYYL